MSICVYCTVKPQIVCIFDPKICWSHGTHICVLLEDPLWSSGHDTRLPNGRAVVRIRGSANAFEPKRIRICDHEASTPGESCGSSTQRVLLNNCLQLISQLACLKCKDCQPLVGGVWQSFLDRSTP